MIVKNYIKNNFEIYKNFSEASVLGGGGGGSWEMNLNSENMATASAAYKTAATEYDTALENLKTKLQAMEGYWEGDASKDWNQAVADLKTKLDAVSTTLNGNATNLSSISAAVVEAETEISTGLQGL